MYTKYEDWRKRLSLNESQYEEVTCPGTESESGKEWEQSRGARRHPPWCTWPVGRSSHRATRARSQRDTVPTSAPVTRGCGEQTRMIPRLVQQRAGPRGPVQTTQHTAAPPRQPGPNRGHPAGTSCPSGTRPSQSQGADSLCFIQLHGTGQWLVLLYEFSTDARPQVRVSVEAVESGWRTQAVADSGAQGLSALVWYRAFFFTLESTPAGD